MAPVILAIVGLVSAKEAEQLKTLEFRILDKHGSAISNVACFFVDRDPRESSRPEFRMKLDKPTRGLHVELPVFSDLVFVYGESPQQIIEHSARPKFGEIVDPSNKSCYRVQSFGPFRGILASNLDPNLRISFSFDARGKVAKSDSQGKFAMKLSEHARDGYLAFYHLRRGWAIIKTEEAIQRSVNGTMKVDLLPTDEFKHRYSEHLHQD